MHNLRIASRESKLAMVQTEFVKNKLLHLNANLNIEIVGLTTEGDRKLEVSLAKIGGKGLFIKELEQAIFAEKADCAVHSMKDVPMTLPEGLIIAAILKREDPRDAFVSAKYNDLNELPKGAIVGTSSLRRQCLIKAKRPDLEIKLLRGNVITRLQKMESGEYDAIILAAAGLKRLGLEEKIKKYFSTDEFIPAVGQGAIGVECVAHAEINEIIENLNDAETAICVKAERVISRELNAGCHIPLGAFARCENNKIFLKAMLGNPKTNQLIFAHAEGDIAQAEEIGLQVAQSLLAQGAQEILEQI